MKKIRIFGYDEIKKYLGKNINDHQKVLGEDHDSHFTFYYKQ